MKRSIVILIACTLLLPFCTACGDSAESSGGQRKSGRTEKQSTETAEETIPTYPEEDETYWNPDDPPYGESEATDISDIPQDIANYEVRPAEWMDIQWTQYQCAYFTLMIPEGWQVEWDGNSEALVWQARAGDGSMLGLSNTDHLIAAKNAEICNMLGHSFYLENGTVEELFSKMFAPTTEYFTVLNSCVPVNKDYLQSLRSDKAIWDYQSLYASFSENGVEGEGIYSAVIMEAPDLILTGGYNYAMWEINGVFTEYAPIGELVNWQPVLCQIAQSFTYTDYYWQEMMDRLGNRVEPISTSGDTDPVMEAFEERMTEDEIIQAKRSDMIGEYERVYDNETGNIYRAYDGFLDDIGSDQTRYSAITDSQYAEGYVGWIDK